MVGSKGISENNETLKSFSQVWINISRWTNSWVCRIKVRVVSPHANSSFEEGLAVSAA